MRILYFYQYFATPRGSWGTRAYEFARRWVEHGDQVTVVTSVYDKSDLEPQGLAHRYHVDGIEVIVLNVQLSNKHGAVKRLLTFGLYAILASYFALREPADVVVSSSGPLSVGFPGLVARYVRKLPFVFEVRDLWPEVPIQMGIIDNKHAARWARRFERACYRGAQQIVALSEGMKRWIRTHYGYDHVSVVPNASDNELFSRPTQNGSLPSWAEETNMVLFTGTLGVANDCWQIIHMAERLRARGRTDVTVVFVGDGKERPDIEAYVHDKDLSNVRFVDLMPKSELVAWVQRACCTLLVLTPLDILDTSSPNKLFDSLAAGVPIVQTTQGWIKDLLDRERCGLTVPQGDPEAMAGAVLRLVEDTDLREEMAGNARRVAREQFDRDLLAEKMHGLLQRAARSNGRPAS